MSFARDKARMLRVLRACDAPPEVVAEFEAIARHWTPGDVSTAEDVLLDACKRQNFTAPWQDGDREVVFRPYSIGSGHSEHLTDHSNTADGEQSYRRGFHQGMAHVLNELGRGRPLAEIQAFEERVREWRRQPVQYSAAHPGDLRPEGLPSKWDGI